MLQTLAEPLTRADIAQYAGASGDYNPMHVDEEYARSIGLRSVMAHGMLTMGLVARMVAHEPRDGPPRTFAGRFVDRTWPGEVIIGEATRDGATLNLVARADGRVVFTGSASFADPKRRAAPSTVAREYELPVERHHIRLLATALGLVDRRHYDDEAARNEGFRGVVAPLTFARAALMYDPARTRPEGRRGRRVAGEHRFDYYAPICAGDLVTCRVHPARSWTKEGRRGGTLTFREEVTSLQVEGQLCLVSTAIGIEPERIA